MGTESVSRTRSDAGLTLLSECLPAVRSAAVGIWVKRGSRDEPDRRHGIAHFVEHMLFKGAGGRSTREIATTIDSMGGQLDAFTAQEMAGYYARVLDEHLDAAFDLLADLVLEPAFDPDELEREREVVLEEIAAAEDDPEDVLFEAFLSRFWPDHRMGRPILGTPASVGALTRDHLSEYVDDLQAGDLVIAAAGNLEHERFAEHVERRFGRAPGGPGRSRERRRPRSRGHLQVLDRQELEQAHLYVACNAPPAHDEGRYAAHVLNTILGASVSSRLFQSIREERGLAYSVYSSLAAFSDTGYLWIAAATRPRSAAEVVELILVELDRLLVEPVPEDELIRAKEYLKGSLMLSLEGTLGRLAHLARQEIGFGRTTDLDRVVARIEAVTSEDVQRQAAAMIDETLSVGFIARRQAADALRDHYAEGIRGPGGALLGLETPAPSKAS